MEIPGGGRARRDMVDEPHAKRRGNLKNSNPGGDPSKAARCEALTRSGAPCRSPAMPNGRCRMHGGASTGPRTPEGLQRSRRSNWKHGGFSVSAKKEAEQVRALMHEIRKIVASFDENGLEN